MRLPRYASPELAKRRTQLQLVVRVHIQNVHRRATDGGQPDGVNAIHLEVLFPTILPRMKQQSQLRRNRGSARDVARLRQIAIDARKSEILVVVCPAMLLRVDMFDLQSGERRIVLMQASILATRVGPLPNQTFRGCVDHD